jgi:hypothetical protein
MIMEPKALDTSILLRFEEQKNACIPWWNIFVGSDKLSVDGELLTRGEIGDQPLTYQNLQSKDFLYNIEKK